MPSTATQKTSVSTSKSVQGESNINQTCEFSSPRRTRVLTQKLSGNECGLPNGAEDSVGEERTIPMYPVHQTQCDRGPLMNGYNLATSPPNQATTSVTHPSSFSLREDSLYVVDSRLRGGASNPEADGILPDDSAFSYIGQLPYQSLSRSL